MSTQLAPEPLSLAELELFDPRATSAAGAERRFCCPCCGSDKPRDMAHRSLSLNTASGAWTCHRCHTAGKLTDFHQPRPRLNRREQSRQRARDRFAFRPAPPTAAPKLEPAFDFWAHYPNLQPIGGTPGAAYLQARGIPDAVAAAAGVLFSPACYGSPAAVFLIHDRAGALVAAQGRYIDGTTTPKVRTSGPKRNGVFNASCAIATPEGPRTFTPWCAAAPAIILTEAPIDALSLAAAGYPAVALCGTSGPDWLRIACGLRRVLLAFDADAAGDKATADMTETLTPYGARCQRLRPEGGKDWNEILLSVGADTLSDWMVTRVYGE